MHPRPSAETTSPSVPSVRFSTLSPPQRELRTLSTLTRALYVLKDTNISHRLSISVITDHFKYTARRGERSSERRPAWRRRGHPATGRWDEGEEAMSEIGPGVLEQLRRYDTPTVCNLIELFDVR